MKVADFKWVGDLVIENGDFALDEDSDKAHLEDIIIAGKGSYRSDVLIGVELPKYINAPADGFVINDFRKKVKLQGAYDGLKIVKMLFKGGLTDVQIDAKRVKNG